MKNNTVFDLVTPAGLHTKKILDDFNFKKFNFSKWLYYAFVLFMSSSLFGLNFNFNELIKENITSSPSFVSSPNFVFLIIGLIIVCFILSFVWMYLSCNFTYILNDSVLLNKRDIKEFWAKNNKKAKSYYFLLIKIIVMMILACIVGGFLIALIGGMASSSGSSVGVGIAGGCLAFTIFLIIGLAFGIYMMLIANFAVPLHLRVDENIPVAQVLKNLYNELKAKKELGKGAMAILALFLVNCGVNMVYSIFSMMFVAVIFLFYSFLSKSPVFWVIFAFIFLIYFAIMLFLNVPGGIFISSYRLLLVSFLSPENAVLLPLRDEKGKFVGTMSYFEHLEREQAEATNMNDYSSYPQM